MNIAFPAAVASLALCGVAGNRIGDHFGSAKLGTFIGLAAGVFVANMVGETLSSREEKIGAPTINESAAEEKIALEKAEREAEREKREASIAQTETVARDEGVVRRKAAPGTDTKADGGNPGFYGLGGPLVVRKAQ